MYLYKVHDYGKMIADRRRTDAYAQALRQTIKPGSIVVDIGTGVGIWALLACQFGARKVFAIEPNNAIQLAREIAADNGYSDRIEFIQSPSTQLTLPEAADVIVSEIHGVLPLFEHSVTSIIDARRRLLAPGGKMIPQQETLWVAVVEAPELYSCHQTPWDEDRYGLDLGAVLPMMTNLWFKGRVKPEQLLVDPQCWATLGYAVMESPDVSGAVTWTIAHAGIGHGFIGWFDTTLTDGVGFSNAPAAPDLIFNNAFFPWSEPVNLAVGDTVSIALQANLVGENYIWRWDTCVLDQGLPERVKASFKQSTFFGETLSPAHLRKLAADYVPSLSEDGEIDQFILRRVDGKTTLREIADQVAERFPARFTEWRMALTRVSELSEKYSRS